MISIDCFDKNWAQVNTDHKKKYQIQKPHTKNNAPVANAFWLKSMTPSEQVMDLKNGSSANGTPVGGWSQNNIYNQLWYEKDGCLWNKRSDTVLDLDNGDTNLQGWDYKPKENNQRWELELHEAYGLSCDPVTGAPVSSSVLTGYADKFTFEPLSFSDLDQLPESVRQWERNLHFIKNYKNQYLGISIDAIGRSKLKFYPDKSAITQLCFLRWNYHSLASVVAFTGSAPEQWYLRIEKDVLSINDGKIGQYEMLSVAEAPGKPGYYTIFDSVHQIYRIKNPALGKLVTFNNNQFQGQKESPMPLGQYWVKIDAGVATGMPDLS
ncbi:MAG: RICIN domain-containing protein [Lewinellaceae bacterium]|nr:RICIN domain-containing protein [Lewinellaceae bacterium]